MSRLIDLKGVRFGRLVVLGDTGARTRFRQPLWECKCDCGNIATVPGFHLRTGNTRSCGCLYRETRNLLTGGTSLLAKHGREHFAAIGKRGGEVTRARHGSDYYAAIGRKGGEATRGAHGKDHYQRMGRRGVAARQAASRAVQP